VNNFGKTVEKAAQRGDQINIDEADLNAMVLQIAGVARDNGLKIPREFALLIKQFLYFDRYAQILAPGMSVYSMGQDAQRLGGKSKLLPKG
jgi:aarF domain-containing kinase